MTAEIDEDGVEVAGDGYDWGRDARELVPELRAEVKRLRAALREARADALREAAEQCQYVIQNYDILKPGKKDQYASREAQICAKGFVRLVEEEILALIDKEAGE